MPTEPKRLSEPPRYGLSCTWNCCHLSSSHAPGLPLVAATNATTSSTARVATSAAAPPVTRRLDWAPRVTLRSISDWASAASPPIAAAAITAEPAARTWLSPAAMAKALFRSFHRNAIRTSTGTAIAAQRTGVGQSAAKIRPDATSATSAARDPVGTTSAAAAPAATPEQARSAIDVARSAANAVAGQTPTATSAAMPPP